MGLPTINYTNEARRNILYEDSLEKFSGVAQVRRESETYEYKKPAPQKNGDVSQDRSLFLSKIESSLSQLPKVDVSASFRALNARFASRQEIVKQPQEASAVKAS